MTTVAFIGTGNMGEAVLAGSLRGGLDPASVRVTAQHDDSVRRLRETHGVAGGMSNTDAVRGADLVVIGVQPEAVPDVLAEIADRLPGAAVVVSLAGGVDIAALESALTPTTPVVRVAPNTGARVGRGMAALTPGTHCDADQLDLVRNFFTLSGDVLVLPEPQLPAVGAVSGSGPAHVFYLADAMIEAGGTAGLSWEVSRRLVLQTIVGAGAQLQETGEHPAVLRERVSSPGGTTLKATGILNERAVHGAIVAAMTDHLRP